DGSAEEFTMNLKVTGNTFALSDTRGTVKGSGTLFGPAWKWTYFKATYESTNGARIEDENYMTDPNVLVGRKRISGPDGKDIGFMHIPRRAIPPGRLETLRKGLKKKKKCPRGGMGIRSSSLGCRSARGERAGPGPPAAAGLTRRSGDEDRAV